MLMTVALGPVFAQGPNGSGDYYLTANGSKGAALRTALCKIINPHHVIGYDGLFEAYEKTDKRADGYVRDWYSCTTNYTFADHGSYTKEGDCYNREHTVPQSWFGSGDIKSDIVHVVPTDGYVNNIRGNYPFGEVANATYQSNEGYCKRGYCKLDGYGDVVFEPNKSIKGDLARIYFYMVTCYKSECTKWGHDFFAKDDAVFEPWAFKMLMRWSKEDPVDEVEINRNIAVYDVQENRNPFVDYPGLEEYIWGDKQEVPFSYDQYEGGSASTTIGMPIFTPDAGTYYNKVTVSISTSTEGATIYYTTNDMEPSENSTLYEGPFTLEESATVRAIAVKDGHKSYRALASYTIQASSGNEPSQDGTITINLCNSLFGVSYDGAIDQSNKEDLAGTKNGIEVVYSLGTGKNRYCSSEQIRLYEGNTLKISATSGKLAEIIFELGKSTSKTLSASAGTMTEALKWEGDANTVTFNVDAGSGNMVLSSIKVKLVTTTTAVQNVPSSLSGQRVFYNLRGQRVAHPSRGLYIVDGKKIYIE